MMTCVDFVDIAIKPEIKETFEYYCMKNKFIILRSRTEKLERKHFNDIGN